MHIILEDNPAVRTALMPLTLTRPIGALPAGICDTIAQRWQRLFPEATIGFDTEPYLAGKFPMGGEGIRVPGNIIPTPETAEAILRGEETDAPRYNSLTDIFRLSKERIVADFRLLTAGRKSAPLPSSSTLIGPESQLFIEPGAEVEGAFINVKNGPVYIGADSEIQESVVLRGPISIGRGCRVRAGARLLPGVNLGPVTRVGGEISNTVFLGYSNKQHDGFLGDGVIGEWVNLGAGCVASNLKNNYAEIRLWSYASRRFERTGLLFCGLIMGDHTKAAINTTFNTATVVGVGCNIHGYGFPRPFVSSFTDGGLQSVGRVALKQLLQTASVAMSHRGVTLTEEDSRILEHLYNNSEI